MNESAHGRHAMLDVAKGLGIILVVLGHGWIAQHDKGELFRIIFSFHVPLFFFLSGVLLKAGVSASRFAMSRMQGLLKPYAAMMLCLGLYRALHEWMRTRQAPTEIWAFAESVAYGSGMRLPPEWVSAWFLPHLFLLSCLAYALVKLCRREWLLWPLAGLMLAGGVMSLGRLDDLPWSLDLVPLTLPFVLLGYLCRGQVRSGQVGMRTGLAALLVFAALHAGFDETMDLNMRVYGQWLVSTVQALAGIVVLLALATALSAWPRLRQWLAYIGSGSLFILMLHSVVQFRSYVLLLGLTGGHQALAGVLSFMLAVALPLVAWELVRGSRLLSRLFLPTKVVPPTGIEPVSAA